MALIAGFFRRIYQYVFGAQSEPTPPQTPQEPPKKPTLGDVFVDETGYSWGAALCTEANRVIRNEEFLKAVEGIQSFDMSTHTGKQIAQKMRELPEVPVRVYTTWNPWSAAIAMEQGDGAVYLNTRRNPRPMAESINTLIHEAVHVAGESHGDNSAYGKENTAPYLIGQMAEVFYGKS